MGATSMSECKRAAILASIFIGSAVGAPAPIVDHPFSPQPPAPVPAYPQHPPPPAVLYPNSPELFPASPQEPLPAVPAPDSPGLIPAIHQHPPRAVPIPVIPPPAVPVLDNL